MPTAKGGNINFGINMTVNKNGLNQILKPLQQIQTKLNSMNTDKMSDEFKSAASSAKQLESIINSSWNDKLGQLNLDKFNQSIKTSYGNVSQLKNSLSGAGAAGQSAFNALASQVLNTNLQLKQSNKLLDDMATSMANTVKWSITSSIVNNISSAIQKAFYYSKDLDRSLNDIRIVTGDSADNMERFAKTANNAAKELGRSTLDYTKAATTFFQQGLGQEQVEERTAITLKAENITGAGSEMADYLTAVWNGFTDSTVSAEQMVDKLAKVADSSASNMSQLAIAMSKTASIASVMGVDIDHLAAQLATVIQTTRQAPEAVGTAFKTIYTRINDIKAGSDEAEVSLGNYSSQMAALGFSVLDANNNLRDTQDVIEQVGNRWSTLTKEQQVSLAQIMGGTRQVNQIMALFEGWTTYSELLNDSLSAQGTLNEKNAIYLESTAAHMEKLGTEAERTYDILFDQKTVNSFVDIFKDALGVFNDYIEGIGGGTNVFLNLGMVAANVFNKQIGSAINTQIKNLELFKNNLAQIKAQQDFSQDILQRQVLDVATVNHSPNEYISRAGLEKQAEITKRTLEVRKALTQEQYNELQNLQKKIGIIQTQIDYLNQYKQIGREILYNEDATVGEFKARLDIEKEQLKVEQSIGQAIAEAANNYRLYNGADQQNLQLQLAIQSAIKSQNLTVEEKNKLTNYIVKLNNEDELTNDQIREIIELQNSAIKKQQQLVDQVNQGYQGRKAAEDGTTKNLKEQIAAGQRIAKQQQDQAERQLRIQGLVTKITGGVQAVSAALGGLNIALDASATASEKMNGIWQGLTGTISGIANMFMPGSGLLIQGIAGLVKSSLELTGIWDAIENNFTSLEQKLEKVNEKIRKVGQIDSSTNQKISSMQSLADEYAALSEKAGKYGQNISKMTQEEQDRYYELTDTFSSYNDTVILGYNAQGHAIVNNQTLIEDTIALLKKQREEAAKAELGTEKNIKSMLEDKEAAFNIADNVLEDAEKNLNYVKSNAIREEGGVDPQVLVQQGDVAFSNLLSTLNHLDEESKNALRKANITSQNISQQVNNIIRGTDTLTIESLQNWIDTINEIKKVLSGNDLENFENFVVLPIEEIANLYNKQDQAVQKAQEAVNAAQAEVDKLGKEGQTFDTYFIKQLLQYSDLFGQNVKTLLNSEDVDPEIINLLWNYISGYRYFKDIEGGIDTQQQKASSYSKVLEEADSYAKGLLDLIKNRSSILKLIDDQIINLNDKNSSQDQEIKIKAKETTQNTIDALTQFFNGEEIQKALKEDDTSKDVITRYLEGKISNLEDVIVVYNRKTDSYRAIIKTKEEQLVSEIIKAFSSPIQTTDSEKNSLEEWLLETYGLDQLSDIVKDLDKIIKDQSWSNQSSFQAIIEQWLDKEKNDEAVENLIKDINKVESVIKKLGENKDLSLKDKSVLSKYLDISEQDKEKLKTSQQWVERVTEQLKEKLKDNKDVLLQLFKELFPDLKSLQASGLKGDELWDELYDNAFQNELQTLKIDIDTLHQYAKVKEIATQSDEQILNIYKIGQEYSTLASKVKSAKDAIVEYKKAGKENIDSIFSTVQPLKESLEKIFGEDISIDFDWIIQNIQGVNHALQEGIQDWDSFYEAATTYDTSEDKLKQIIEDFDSLKSKLEEGKELTDAEKQSLQQIIDYLIQVYPDVAASAQMLKQTWLSGTDAYKQVLQDVQEAIDNLQIDQIKDKFDDAFDAIEDLGEIDIEVNPEGLNDWIDKVQDFLSVDRELTVNIHADEMGEFDRIMDQMDTIYNAAGKIGQNFIVAANDIQQLNRVFPGIIQGMQMLDDGSYQLNSNMVQRAIATAQIEVDSDAQSNAQRLEAQAAYEREQAAIYRQMAQAARVLAGEQIDSTMTRVQAQQVLTKGLSKIEQDESERIAKQYAINQKEITDSSEENAKILSQNMVSAANASNEAVYNASNDMINNLVAVATAFSKAMNGEIPNVKTALNVIKNSFDGVKGKITAITASNAQEPTVTLTNPSALARDLDTQADFKERLADQYEAAAAAERAKNRKIDVGLSNVEKGYDISGPKQEEIKDTGKSKSGGSGSSKTPKETTSKETTPKEQKEKYTAPVTTKETELLDQTVDRYHDINNTIDSIERSLKRVQKQQEKMLGLGLIESLKKQLELIEKQKKAEQQKLTIQRKERTELQAILTKQGVSFNSDGFIANYKQAMQKALNETNQAIAFYNNEIQQIDQKLNSNQNYTDRTKAEFEDTKKYYQEQQELAKDQYNKFKENIERYDKLVTDEIEDAKDKIQELSDQEIELKIQKSNVIVELRLQVEDFKRDWIKFKKEVLEGISSSDINGIVKNSQKNLDLIRTYYNPDAISDAEKGTLYISAKHLEEVMGEIKKIQSGDYSGTYGDDINKAYKDLKTYQEKAMDAATSLKDLVTQMADNVLESIDKAKEAFDDHIEQYDNITKSLDHQAKLIQLIYGDKAYDLMDKYYQAQEKNNNAAIEFLRLQKEEWQRQLAAELAYRETLSKDTEQYNLSTQKINKFKKNLQETIQSINSAVERALQNLIDKYHNTINKIFNDLEKELTGGSSFDRVGEEWELINKHADMYLDNVNRIYETDKLRGAYEKAISDYSGNIKAQKSLNKLMEQQLKYLQEKQKVSEYDVQRANALLDIEVKRLALEQQRQQKTQLRLRRDAQGNYTYEYTSDEEDIASARQDLLDAQNDLYNLTKEHYKDNLEDYYNTLQEMNNKIKEVYMDNTLSEEERNERILEIRQRYEPILNDLARDNVELRKNLEQDATNFLVTLYTTDAENMKRIKEQAAKEIAEQTGQSADDIKLTAEDLAKFIEDKAKQAIEDPNGGLVPLWESGIQKMIDKIQEQGGLQPIYDRAIEQMEEATKQLEQDIEQLEDSAGENFEDIGETIDQTTEQTQELHDQNIDLITTYKNLIEQAKRLYDAAMKVWNAFKDNNDKILELINNGANMISTIEQATNAFHDLANAIREAADAAANGDFSVTHEIKTVYTTEGSPPSDNYNNNYSNNYSNNYNSGGGGGYDSGGYDSGTQYASDEDISNYINSFGGGQSYDIVLSSNEVLTPTADGQWKEGLHYSDGSYEERWTSHSYHGYIGRVKGSFDTGGYTGNWNSNEGRLAVLHEKELILNKEDTQNILSAVNVVRAMQGLIRNISLANHIPDMTGLISGIQTGNSMQDLNQRVSIEAHFPNVTNSNEIETALNNLVNQASQYIHQHNY